MALRKRGHSACRRTQTRFKKQNVPVLCLIADNVPRGKVSEGRADIDSVAVYVDGQFYEDAVQVTGQDDGQPAFWRQHPYKGTFAPISVNIPLEEGTHIIRVETSPNAAGNTGFDEVAVTLEKREIPLDLEGAAPPPPPTPETRGLWHFEPATPGQVFAPPDAPFEPDGCTALLLHLEEADSAADSSPYYNNGTLYGSPASLQPGRFGSCVTFDGWDDFIDCGYGYLFDFGSSEFTLEAWVCPANTSGYQTIFSHSNGMNGYCLRLECGTPVFRSYMVYPEFGEYATYGTSLAPGAWTHIAVVRWGERETVYVNGVDSWGGVELPAWSALYPCSGPLMVGAGTSGYGYPCDFFYGAIDEVRVSAVARYVPPPVVTPDASGHGNDATERGQVLISD